MTINENTPITVTFPLGQIGIIGSLLAKAPYELAKPVIESLEAQVNTQLRSMRDAPVVSEDSSE